MHIIVRDYAGINADPPAMLTSDGRSRLQRSKASQLAWP